MTKQAVRHILGLSGGKDSTALAIYMRDRVAEMEYVFCDTGHDLPEVYEYLDRLEAYLGTQIIRLQNGGRDFDHYLAMYRGFLPSPQARWCTKHLKIEPLERYIGDDRAYSYVAIRADEEREGYISTKPNIQPVFPLREDGMAKQDVLRILDSAGLGLPSYYEWRSRSGCYFCFYQRKIEWVGLLEHHPQLFDKAKQYERADAVTGDRYTWSEGESLEELSRPERLAEIKEEYAREVASADNSSQNRPLIEVLSQADLI